MAEYLETRGWSVWWDRKIPVGRPFDEEIESALRQARCVVVLWTKEAVASRWVRSEASDAAQRQVLVPVLVADVTIPLEFRMLQALDLMEWRSGTTPPALEQLHEAVARIVGYVPSTPTIVEGDGAMVPTRSRSVRLSPSIAAGTAALIVILASLGWYWDAFHREIREYYANVTTRWGLPEGVGRLTAGQVFHRNATVVLLRRGRRNPAHEVRVVNSAGLTPPLGFGLPIQSVVDLNPLPSNGADGPVSSEIVNVTRVTFLRDANGRLLEQVGFNRGGRRLYTMHFAEPDLGEYKRGGFGAATRESGISYLRYSRVAGGPFAGRVESVQYLDDKQRPQPDVNGEFGHRLVLNDSGLVTEMVNRGPDGSDKADRNGVLKEIRSYDAFGNVCEGSSRDEHGAPKASRLAPSTARLEYDAWGNTERMSFLDEKGQPVVEPALRAARLEFTYDLHGNITSETFFDPDQKIVVSQQGFAKQKIEWDTPTRYRSRYFGSNGQPIPGLGGVFQILVTLDPQGYPSETTYADLQGQPSRAEDGCATERVRFNEGDLVSLTCLNEQGVPTISVDGFSSVTATYDRYGNRETSTYYDLQGAHGLQGDTYTSVHRRFTPSGLVEEETYLNAKGALVKNRQGFAVVKYAFDGSANKVGEEYFDEHSNRAMVVGGYSAIRRKFDERGLESETSYRDLEDRPAVGPEGYATQRYLYDRRGFVIRFQQFGVDGTPSRGVDGYCSAVIKRGDVGEALEVAYLDERGGPTIAARFGSAIRKMTYDAGRLIERTDLDVSGRRITNAFGYSIVRYRYDDHGRDAGRELLDPSGRRLELKIGVDRVDRGSVASEVGLQAGDIVLTYDGQVVSSVDQFTRTFELFRGDRAREVRIERAGRVLSLDVPPGRLHGLKLTEMVPAAPR